MLSVKLRKKAYPFVSFNTRLGLIPVEFGRDYYGNKLHEMTGKNPNLTQLAPEEMDETENQENIFIDQKIESEEKTNKKIYPYELPENKKDNEQLREWVDDFYIIEPTLANNYRDCEAIMDHLVIPMLESDLAVGTDLWLKLLKDFYPQEKDFAYDGFTNHPFYEADRDLFIRAFEFSPELKEYLFHLSPSDNTYYVASFMQDLVLHKQYDLPNEILLLYCDNHHGAHDSEKTLYETLSDITSGSKSNWLIDEGGIAFVEKWMDALADEVDKAKIRIKLRSLKKIVFEGAEKGAVPLGIINELDPSDEQVKSVKRALGLSE